jgi:hypothetical protein
MFHRYIWCPLLWTWSAFGQRDCEMLHTFLLSLHYRSIIPTWVDQPTNVYRRKQISKVLIMQCRSSKCLSDPYIPLISELAGTLSLCSSRMQIRRFTLATLSCYNICAFGEQTGTKGSELNSSIRSRNVISPPPRFIVNVVLIYCFRSWTLHRFGSVSELHLYISWYPPQFWCQLLLHCFQIAPNRLFGLLFIAFLFLPHKP